MNENLIGEQIAKLRKAAGITQEDLGRAVGVSAQAVSRWECGGTPDVLLLPALADRLGVAIDALFGREGGEAQDIMETLARWLRAQPQGDRTARLVRALWEANMRAIPDVNIPFVYPEEGELDSKMIDKERVVLRTVISTDEETVLGVGGEDFSFLCLLPEPEGGYSRYFPSDEASSKLFSALAMPGSLQILRLLDEPKANFCVASVAAKRTGVTGEEAERALAALEAAGLLETIELTLEEGTVPAYTLKEPHGLVALLYLARWVSQREHVFFFNWSTRNKPYLKAEAPEADAKT